MFRGPTAAGLILLTSDRTPGHSMTTGAFIAAGQRTRIANRTVSKQTHAKREAPRSPDPCVSIIMPAQNEAETVRRNIRRLRKWSRVGEIIVIANGCTDNTARIARREGATVIEYKESLGHDTGRAIGARYAKEKFLLFLDADIVWNVAELRPFINHLTRGADVALNTYPDKKCKYYHHPTAIAKRALNIALKRPDLHAASFTTVPHSLRRTVLDKIGYECLATPPLAHARAVLAGLSIVEACYIDVRSRNRWNRRRGKSYSKRELIIGDHLEAMAYVQKKLGERGGFQDGSRQRAVIEPFANGDVASANHSVAAVIPARNEARTLAAVLREVRDAKIGHVCVVENGSSDGTKDVALQHAAEVQHFDHPLGHDVGRAIGAIATGNAECTVFLDSDFPITAHDLKVFKRSVLKSKVDVALNDLTAGLPPFRRRDMVSTMKAFLNICLHREDLGVCSMTAIPHALSRRALETIPAADLAVPPKALVRAVLAGLNIKPVHNVDVVKANRYRRKLHSSRHGSPVAQMIVGDHLEAIALLIDNRGRRGGFVQPRKLAVLHD